MEQVTTEMTLADLKARRAAVEAQIAEALKTERDGAIAQIKQVMADYEITVEDLQKRAKASKKDGAERAPVAPKYALDDKTWTGRGKRPKWVDEAVAAGYSLEDLLINKPAVEGEAA